MVKGMLVNKNKILFTPTVVEVLFLNLVVTRNRTFINEVLFFYLILGGEANEKNNGLIAKYCNANRLSE